VFFLLALASATVLATQVLALTMIDLGNGTSYGFGYDNGGTDVDWKYTSEMQGSVELITFKVRVCCDTCPPPCASCGVKGTIEWAITDKNYNPVPPSAGGAGSMSTPSTPCQSCWNMNVNTNVNWAQAGLGNSPSSQIQLAITANCYCCATGEDYTGETTNEIVDPVRIP
jgi:hypothetical protein